MRRFCLTITILAAGLLVHPATTAQPSLILQAMQEEMTRAMDGLRLGNEPPPYFIAYSVEDVTLNRLQTRLGAVVRDATERTRLFRVDVRVGDYEFDSSRFLSLDRDPGELASYGTYGLRVPLDEDYYVMRRQIWLATDAAYKRAVQTLARKKASAQSKARDPDQPADFSKEPVTERVQAGAPPARGARGLLEDLKTVSGVFAAHPDVHASDASLQETYGTRYFLTTEGTRVVEPTSMISLSVTASTQAADGMPLRDTFSAFGRTAADLPPTADLVARATYLARSLTAARTAPVGDEFTGPVLVEGEAAAALMAQTLVPLFLSQRAPEADGVLASVSQQMPPTFLTRIGSSVLPASFLVSDTPSLERFGQAPVPGAYAVDDDGVVAEDVKLVQDGKLLTLLTTRTPQKGLPQSNGHARYAGAQAGVFQVECTRAVPAADLKPRYLQMLKEQSRPHGYILRSIAGVIDPLAMAGDEDFSSALAMLAGTSGGRSGPLILRAVRVLPDGTEQMVRGVRLGAVQPLAYRMIEEASRERTLYNYRGGITGSSLMTGAPMRAMPPVVSLIVPSLIFEELEIQRTQDTGMKPPVVPPPAKK